MSIMPAKTSDSVSLAQLMLKNCEEKMESKAAKGVLSNYRGLMGLARAAVSAFLAGDLPDPLVGENACQIRAALYAHIIQDGEMMTDLKKVCALIEKNHGELEHIKLPEGKARYSVMDVLQSQQLDLCVPLRMSSVIGPILFGHILTVTKLSDLKIEKAEVSLKESNDPKLLQGLSVGFAKDIIREGRKVLSNCSIQYLRNEVRLLPMSSRKRAVDYPYGEGCFERSLRVAYSSSAPGDGNSIGKYEKSSYAHCPKRSDDRWRGQRNRQGRNPLCTYGERGKV